MVFCCVCWYVCAHCDEAWLIAARRRRTTSRVRPGPPCHRLEVALVTGRRGHHPDGGARVASRLTPRDVLSREVVSRAPGAPASDAPAGGARRRPPRRSQAARSAPRPLRKFASALARSFSTMAATLRSPRGSRPKNASQLRRPSPPARVAWLQRRGAHKSPNAAALARPRLPD